MSPKGSISIGSSPRLRGTLLEIPASSAEIRFIPAPAGNTRVRERPPARPPVHPRACGEHEIVLKTFEILVGSSPRLRGTPTNNEPLSETSRFIPAPAGNTNTQNTGVLIISVHPRACGEHSWGYHAVWCDSGSSPRLRGTHGGRWN
ncbi:hypothetical protein APM_3479 [Acidiphilium sp. PM]|nr:hypothetical protein APM_3479 [Acidiphilium sp. PM]